MIQNKRAEFAVRILKQYAKECGTLPRSTSDLSPMEEWLILQLHAFTEVSKTTERVQELVTCSACHCEDPTVDLYLFDGMCASCTEKSLYDTDLNLKACLYNERRKIEL